MLLSLLLPLLSHPFNGLFSRTSLSRNQKGKPFWIYWSKRWWDGSGIICTICKSFAPRSGQITMPVPHLSVFTGQMPFLPPNQQCQSTEGYCYLSAITVRDIPCLELSVDLRHLCSEGPKSEIWHIQLPRSSQHQVWCEQGHRHLHTTTAYSAYTSLKYRWRLLNIYRTLHCPRSAVHLLHVFTQLLSNKNDPDI